MRRKPAGKWGIWLVARREERGKGQTETFDALRKLPEFPWGPDSRASYSKWEYGQGEPDAAQQAALLRFYGAEAPTDEASPGERDGPGDALIAALADQTAALDRQAEVIGRLAAAIEGLVQAQPTPEDLIELVRSGLLGPVGGGGVGAGARQQ